MLPGDLVYYDKRGGAIQMTFPFGEKDATGLGIIVSEIMIHTRRGVAIKWVWILDENGNKLDFTLDYLEPVII